MKLNKLFSDVEPKALQNRDYRWDEKSQDKILDNPDFLISDFCSLYCKEMNPNRDNDLANLKNKKLELFNC